MQRSGKKRHPVAHPPPQPVTENRVISAQWSGPMPPPSTLREFESVVPGSAERIVRMAELEQSHRHASENAMLNADESVMQRGHWLWR